MLEGWVPNPKGVEEYLNDPANKYPVFTSSAREVLDNYEQSDTFLYEPLVWCNPNYKRGTQAIGSCVAWGAELACTILTAKNAFKKKNKKLFFEVATEPIYGGSRVEINGGKLGGYSDGSYGAAAARFVREWGVLFRKDYSKETKIPDHDLRTYDGKKEKEWGNFGCGGKNDKGRLDEVAKKFPCKTTTLITCFDDAAAAIAGAKCPVTIASSYGTDMRRDKNGFCKWNTSWMHQMVLIGVRFDKPGLLCAQSWGPNVAGGPHFPDNMPENIKGFTWWIPAEDIDKICRHGDCHAIGDIEGWKIDPTNFGDLGW